MSSHAANLSARTDPSTTTDAALIEGICQLFDECNQFAHRVGGFPIWNIPDGRVHLQKALKTQVDGQPSFDRFVVDLVKVIGDGRDPRIPRVMEGRTVAGAAGHLLAALAGVFRKTTYQDIYFLRNRASHPLRDEDHGRLGRIFDRLTGTVCLAVEDSRGWRKAQQAILRQLRDILEELMAAMRRLEVELRPGIAQEIREFLEVRGGISQVETVEPDLLHVVSREGVFRHYYWYYCPENPVDRAGVARFIDRVQGSPGSQGYLVSTHSADAEAKELLQEHRGIVSVCSPPAFYLAMLEWEGYLRQLSESVSQEVEPYWIDLKAQASSGEPIPIAEFADRWLTNPSGNLLALLGDFGMGKTWFSRHHAARLARTILTEQGNGRLPVFIPLRGWDRVQSMEKHVTALLMNEARAQFGSYKVFDFLNRRGRLALVFDGFDEMEQRVDRDVALRNFREVLGTIHPRSKVILTSRRGFFAEALASFLENEARDVHPELLTLCHFEKGQIQQALEKRLGADASAWWEQIQHNEHLCNLVSRPVMIRVLAESPPGGIDPQRVSAASLYQQCITRGWIQRDCPATHNQPQMQQQVLAFLSDLAAELCHGPQSLSRDDFSRRARQAFGSDELAAEVSRLLVPDQAGNLAFPHPSFVEYLVAGKIVNELRQGNGQALFHFPLTDGILAFLTEIIQAEQPAASSDASPLDRGLWEAVRSGKSGSQMDAIIRLLHGFADDGNPVTALLALAGRVAAGPPATALPDSVIAALGQDEYLAPLRTRLPSVAGSAVDLYWLDLWGSPAVAAGQASAELRRVVMGTGFPLTVRHRAIQVLAQRGGKEEAQVLLDAIRSLELRMELRLGCLERMSLSPPTDPQACEQFLGALWEVIIRENEPHKLRRDCVSCLSRVPSPGAGHRLLTILMDYDHYKPTVWDAAAGAISSMSDPAIADIIEKRICPEIADEEDRGGLQSAVDIIRENIRGRLGSGVR